LRILLRAPVQQRPPSSTDFNIRFRVCWHEASHAIIGRQLHAAALGGSTVEGGLDHSGLTWGPAYVRQAKFSDSQDDVPTLCSQLTGVMPTLGESRTECAPFICIAFIAWSNLSAAPKASGFS
jgi:hypothetical protein